MPPCSSDPTGQADTSEIHQVSGNKTKMMQSTETQKKQLDATATAATIKKECSPRRRKRTGNKHNKMAERLRQERLIQESILRHTRVFTVRSNPDFFVRVEHKNIREDEWPETAHTVSEEEADAEE